MNTAAKSKPAKAAATVAKPPAAPMKPARPPAGSRPDAAAVERIRALQGEMSRLAMDVDEAAAAVKEPEERLRNEIHGKVYSRRNLYELPVDEVWRLFLQAWKPRPDEHATLLQFGDYEEAYALYKAVHDEYTAKIAARDEAREALNAAIDAELPKLQVAVDERTESVLKEVIAAILPYCRDEGEAKELAEHFSRVSELRDARGRCFFAGPGSPSVTRASYFLTALETFRASGVNASQG